MRVAETIEIACSPAAVWAVVADPCNDPDWCRKVRSVEAVDGRRWQARHKPIPVRPARDLLVTHIAVDAPRRLVAEQEDLAGVFEIEYRLEATPAGTRFTQVSRFEMEDVPRVLHPAFGWAVRHEVRSQLRALRDLVERRAPERGTLRPSGAVAAAVEDEP